MKSSAKVLMVVAAVIVAAGSWITNAQASHSWGNYHWARTSNPFNLSLGSNLSADWRPYLNTTSSDWSASAVVDTTVVSGSTKPRNCRPKEGRVEVCNAFYGSNGWLGIAQIWISGPHITQGIVKLNDTYMTKPPYNTPEEKNHVMCQEVGHTLGLGHQDESGAALGTCMDYSMDAGSQHPNAHDYEQLESIYAHLDSFTSIKSTTTGSSRLDGNDGEQWGKLVRRSANGRSEVYEHDLGHGRKKITFVNRIH